MLPPGRTSILNTPLTAEEEAEIAPKAKPKASSRAAASDPQERKRRNQETYQQRFSGSGMKIVVTDGGPGQTPMVNVYQYLVIVERRTDVDMIPMHHFSCICFLRDVFSFTEAKAGDRTRRSSVSHQNN